MSDDTPTERFEPPTAPLPAADGALASTEAPEEGRKRGMLIALIAIAAAILLALIVLIVVLVGNAGSPEASPAPTATLSESPSPTPEETERPEPSDEPSASPSATTPPPPPPQSPSFATFTGPDRATCPDTSNAVSAWFGIGTLNAKAEPFDSVPTTATYTFTYQCSEASQLYTVTLEDASGRLTHSTVEIVRQ